MGSPDCSDLPIRRSASISPPAQHYDMASNVVQPVPSAMSCPLLTLPPELRLLIYEKLFKIHKGKVCLTSVDGVWYKFDSYMVKGMKTRVPGKCVALLATCKNIFTEARPVLFATTPFVLDCCDGSPVALKSHPFPLLDMITHVQTIDLCIGLFELKDPTVENIRTFLAPVVKAINSASSARQLRISLTVSGLREQAYLDRIMLCLGDLQSNASVAMILDTAGESFRQNRNLNLASFIELLKQLLG
jgi:hypothetical protein